jgi:hypothetical protein
MKEKNKEVSKKNFCRLKRFNSLKNGRLWKRMEGNFDYSVGISHTIY